uniref:Uncharacterized protein n=1 Tax=Arundo donax TaxID=35708 RepID=A0A0A9HSI5_ARUDO
MRKLSFWIPAPELIG